MNWQTRAAFMKEITTCSLPQVIKFYYTVSKEEVTVIFYSDKSDSL